MKAHNLRSALCVVALAALAAPAAAWAHPSLYLIVGKIANHAEVQTLTVNATGGTYKPSTNAKTIPWNAPSWQVEDALGADVAIGRNATTGLPNVLVTGANGGPYTVRFQGTLATTNVAPLTPVSTGLTGGTSTASIATVIDGTAANTTYTGDPTGATLQDTPQQAVIANDGNVTMWTESNGLTNHGWLNLKFLPGSYRAVMTGDQWLNYPQVQTGIQTHATCQNVGAINTDANAKAVQENFGNVSGIGDPFWNYVPFQKASVAGGVGGDADPAKWITVVKTSTNGLPGAPAGGVDLATVNDAAAARTACEALGGVYVPADTQGGSQASSQISDAVTAATDPLNLQIADLIAQNTTLTQAADAAEAARLALLNRPLRLTLATRRSHGAVVVMATGKAGAQVTIRLKNGTRVLDTERRTFGAQGAVLVTLRPARAPSHRLAIKAEATSGTQKASATGTLAR